MLKTDYPALGETLWQTTLENGLRVYVVPKPEFGKYYAFFAADYGGNDTRFRVPGEAWTDTPAGVAHYLEHKNFDTREGNALQQFTQNGASPNAFTSAGITGYYFECTEHFQENLRLLLHFVTQPYFTPESVEKERGIIGQEIRMIEDNPGWCVYTGMMRGLYAHHPVRVGVAGTVESIGEITADTLYACHRAFYHPGNMALCVAGPVEPQEVADIAAACVTAGDLGKVERDYGLPERAEACQSMITQAMAVSRPLFRVGFKLPPVEAGESVLARRLTACMAAEVLLGESSPLYAKLYEEGLIDANFGYSYDSYRKAAFLYAGGESRDPERVRQELLDAAAALGKQGIPEKSWQRIKRACYGTAVRCLNSFENICVGQVQCSFSGEDYFRFAEIYANMKKAEVEEFLFCHLAKDTATSLSVISPLE